MGSAARRLAPVLAIGGLAAVAVGAVREPRVQDFARPGVHLVREDAPPRVDVWVDGRPFTSYVYPPSLRKPVLFPLLTASGNPVTRGFPLEPRAGERVDHPHQVGLWFNYGDVNRFDFWNNSEAIAPEDRAKMGTIVHKGVLSTRDGADEGVLEIESEWVQGDGKAVLRERTRFVFRRGPGWRSVDRIARLEALAGRVVMNDNKEGLLGLRVARALELPSKEEAIYADASGRPATVKRMDNTGVSGDYLTSEGKTGDAVWGTRARWCALTGRLGDEPVTVAILDHPSNPGFPTYWHARGYGLFAANPLGQKALSGGRETLNFSIAPGRPETFRYRILILSEKVGPKRLEEDYRAFAGR
jgi:hypothetical protein